MQAAPWVWWGGKGWWGSWAFFLGKDGAGVWVEGEVESDRGQEGHSRDNRTGPAGAYSPLLQSHPPLPTLPSTH